MAAVRVVLRDEVEWTPVHEVATGALADYLSEGELASHITWHHPGGDDLPQLFEVDAPSEATFAPHSHDLDEIIYVLAGELHLGARILTAGSSVFIPGGTLYSFKTGPDGLRFLNFRPHQDLTYRTKDEHVARRSPEA